MPFSRHWIMHIEAMCRITNKLCQKAKKASKRGFYSLGKEILGDDIDQGLQILEENR